MEKVSKYKNTTCHMGEIIIGMSEEDFSWRSKGEGATYRERLQRHIP